MYSAAPPPTGIVLINEAPEANAVLPNATSVAILSNSALPNAIAVDPAEAEILMLAASVIACVILAATALIAVTALANVVIHVLTC